ncbi:hypothetical protein [Bacteroides acidifaciens]|jgi:hypothetical protein|uniref:hypothetical protein n=1 Tax=Bacteroides acidifaciens TaxID=85831 RepID=UPI001B3158F8|nr:hypothetical protein [Bacteroides acidifaciens]MCR2005403.1 hypothetical protein [Bacteroides acidifaciens]
MMTKLVFAIFIIFLTSCWGDTSTVDSSSDNYSSREIKGSDVENETYFCEYCGKKFHSVKDLAANLCKRHPDGAHGGKHKLYEGRVRKTYECVYCGKEAKSIADLTANKCKHSPMGGNHRPRL